MVSIDQVILLEQKVESAVAKIQQLQAENDALRIKCSELTNALSSKSEQLSSFETDQNQIENGILKALDRLNSIENSVLKVTGQASPVSEPKPVQTNPEPVSNNSYNFDDMKPVAQETEQVQEEVIQEQAEVPSEDEEISIPLPKEEPASIFNQTEPEEPQVVTPPNPEDQIQDEDSGYPFDSGFTTEEAPEEESQDDLGFDIF